MNTHIEIKNARIHNLKGVDVSIPKHKLTVITGVSGSGKSSLIADTLVPKLKEQLKARCVMDEDGEDGPEEAIDTRVTLTGVNHIKHCYIIDQRPIGRSRTSCPATYTGIFDRIRSLFAESDKAKAAGYTAGMFSVNSKGGCRKCKGDGVVHYHVGLGNFIDIDCDVCGGSGYISEAMSVTVGGKNIRDVLEMSVDEARDFLRTRIKPLSICL